MPLLKRKAFEKATASGFLKDDDEVFHCEITDEIFKDYEEYCERIILVNSMVWSCEMTGKPNLTYAEALESEKSAMKLLKNFPTEMKTPIIYLSSLTKRTSFAEMTEDVFGYVRDRYFIGEIIEACLQDETWVEAIILSVNLPKPPTANINPLGISSSEYTYEVEELQDDTDAVCQVCTVPKDKIRRKKGLFSREKNKLFLKQFVQQGQGGIIIIKPIILEKFNISKVQFDQIFYGTPPEFPSSKKFMKSLSPPKSEKKKQPSEKKQPNDKKQPSMAKYLTKQDKSTAHNEQQLHKLDHKSGKVTKAKNTGNSLNEKMRLAAEALKQKQIEEKNKEIEKKLKLAAYIKEWNKRKDDLELEDHKVLPKGTLIAMDGIQTKYIGDFLSVLEFIHLNHEVLQTKDFFSGGVTIDVLRKALAIKESAYMFCDLVQMLLETIFRLQEDEAEEYNKGKRILESHEDEQPLEEAIGSTRAVDLATRASKWPQTYLGTPLSKLPLDAYSITEILRLHLLSSGAKGNEGCERWRYNQRGGYRSEDDPGLRLRISKPHVIKALAQKHCADLSLDDKFTIVHCLMNQILSYATVRDIIEEKLEKSKQIKLDIRLLQNSERKRENELSMTCSKLKKDAVKKKIDAKLTGDAAQAVDEAVVAEIGKLGQLGAEKKLEFEKKLKELQTQSFDFSSYLGSDRAHRRYWLNQAISGLFIEACEVDLPCRDKIVQPITSSNGDVLNYVKNLFEMEQGASDKENESNSNSLNNSPKKPNSSMNSGFSQMLNELENLRELLVCTANSATCPVHGSTDGRPKWFVLHTREEVDALLESLNKRGLREHELRQNILAEKESIIEYISKCPLPKLSLDHAKPEVNLIIKTRKFQPSIVVLPDSTPTEALELSLRDYILELEEKVFHGCLGSLQVKDREAWRGTIILRGYDKQAQCLSWGPERKYTDSTKPQMNGKVKLHDDESELKEVDTKNVNKMYRDPGFFLVDVPYQQSESDVGPSATDSHLDDVNLINGVLKKEMEEDTNRKLVRELASALLQVEQCINRKYLKRPLGYDEKERKDTDTKARPFEWKALERWEISLMESQSFSQVALHLLTLENSILWSKSILNASCRLCRRRADPELMLLCDNCNKGHHMYCLKPKLTKVPEGDWFCDQCKPKTKIEAPRKKRRLFVEETSDNEEGDDQIVDLISLCAECGSGGRLLSLCQKCDAPAHTECAKSTCPTTRSYTCFTCRRPESESSEDNIALTSIKKRKSRASKESSPAVSNTRLSNGTSSRPQALKNRRSKESTPIVNGHHDTSTGSGKRKRTARGLHMTELSQLLQDVMKHRDSWPFTEEVDLELVPDYLDIIDTPIDFSKIKESLENGDYMTDEQFMKDCSLVFQNCFIYNKETSSIAKTGVRLEKYFLKRCAELELPGLPQQSDDNHSKSKKARF